MWLLFLFACGGGGGGQSTGGTITDKAIFDKLARKFELHYMEDMEALGIKEPDVLTRVTECVPGVCLEFCSCIRRLQLRCVALFVRARWPLRY